MLKEIDRLARKQYLPNYGNLWKFVDVDGYGTIDYLMGKHGCDTLLQYTNNYYHGLIDGRHFYLMAQIIKNDYQFELPHAFLRDYTNKDFIDFIVYITKHLNKQALVKLVCYTRSKRIYLAALTQLKWLGENHIDFERE